MKVVSCVHYGDAGSGALLCGVKEKKGMEKNWSFEHIAVNCKRCIKLLEKRNAEATEAGYDSLPGAAEDRRTSEAAAARRKKAT